MNYLPASPQDPSKVERRGLMRQHYVTFDVPVQPSASEEHTQHLLFEYWGILKRRRWWVVSLALAGALGGFVSFLLHSPVYRTSTTLELQGLNEAFMNMSAVDLQAGTGAYTASQLNLQTQVKIIESVSIRGPVTERLEREATPVVAPQGGWLGALRVRLGITPPDPLESMRRGVRMAALSLNARPVTGTRLLTITCESTHPEIAASFANAVADEYMSQNLQFRSSSGQKTNQWLASQLEETKAKLEQAESRLQQFVRQSGLQFVTDQDTLAISKLRQLQTELSSLQSDRIAKQARYEMTLSSPPESIPDVLNDSTLRSYQAKLADLQREKALLTATLTHENVKVQRVDAQITELQSVLATEKANIVARIRNEYEAARRREKTLGDAYAAQSKAVAAQADKSAEYGLLRREVDILRQSLNAMLGQANQAGIVAGAPASNIRVIDAAIAPAIPVKPDLMTHASAGIGLGMALGFGLAWLREKSVKRHRESKFGLPGGAASLLNTRELGVIPSASLGEHRYRFWQRGKAVEGNRFATRNGAPQRVELVSLQQQPSLLAESFRLVLASLTVKDPQGREPQVIVISSPDPGEGKTMVACNLAIAMAGTGRRTLVIDADLRKPRLDSIFGLDPGGGFGELILDDQIKEGPIGEILCTTAVEGLRVLQSGSVPNTLMNKLFHSPQVGRLLDRLRGEFDVILIDTPPMLHFSEARLLGRLADGVILVLRSGSTDRESALTSRQLLIDDGIPMLGIILNDWTPEAGQNPYQKYHRYYQNSFTK